MVLRASFNTNFIAQLLFNNSRNNAHSESMVIDKLSEDKMFLDVVENSRFLYHGRVKDFRYYG